MAKFKNSILSEIGDRMGGYDWSVQSTHSHGVVYEFETGENEYEVLVERVMEEFLGVDFTTSGGKMTSKTGEKQALKVASTVIDISRHAWENRNQFFGNAEHLKGFSLAPTSAGRTKLFRRFIEKQFPSAKIEMISSTDMLVILSKQ